MSLKAGCHFVIKCVIMTFYLLHWHAHVNKQSPLLLLLHKSREKMRADDNCFLQNPIYITFWYSFWSSGVSDVPNPAELASALTLVRLNGSKNEIYTSLFRRVWLLSLEFLYFLQFICARFLKHCDTVGKISLITPN